jgi:GT2 family glycosyltransferase
MAALSTAPLRLRSRPQVAAVGTPLLSIVIVNYRRWEETAALVEQLAATEAYFRDSIEIIVVDNASPADPVEEQLRRRGGVRYQRLAENRGFAAGVNAGYEQCHGDWVLVLNPDLIVCPGFIDLICTAAIDAENDLASRLPIGVVGFQLRNRDGTRQLSTGLFPTISKMLLGLLRSRRSRKYELTDNSARQPVAWVTGSCLLIRRTCMNELNGFDEEFFLYYEDVDLCRRARARGWEVCYEPGVEAIHLDPLQNRPLTATMRAITRHASLTYFRKHLAGWQFWALAQLVRAEAWVLERLAASADDAATAHEVRGICRELMRQRPEAARVRLEAILQRAGMKN